MLIEVLVDNKKAFTIIEMIMVIAMIGILVLATTIYLGGTDERRKVIEAQGCAATLGGELANYVFYALTSKRLEDYIVPSSYVIKLTGDATICTGGTVRSGGNHCDKLLFMYFSGGDSVNSGLYKIYSSSNGCRGNNARLSFYWSGEDDIEYIEMKKGFIPTSNSDRKVFYLKKSGGNSDADKLSLGDIIVSLCLNSDCSSPKEISKWIIDGRAQTISTRNCKFYDDQDLTKCKERES